MAAGFGTAVAASEGSRRGAPLSRVVGSNLAGATWKLMELLAVAAGSTFLLAWVGETLMQIHREAAEWGDLRGMYLTVRQ